MSECMVCGQRGSIGMGGVLLCKLHAAGATEWMEEQRAAGKPVDVARWAFRARTAEREQIHVRLSVESIKRLDVLADQRGLSRAAVVEQLIQSAK